DRAGENEQEPQRANCAQPRRIYREQRQSNQHFQEWKSGSEGNRDLLGNTEANGGFSRTNEGSSPCCSSQYKNESQRKPGNQQHKFHVNSFDEVSLRELSKAAKTWLLSAKPRD